MKKEGWEVKKLGEVFELYQPKTISTSEMKPDGEFPVFGANGIIGKYDKYNHEAPELLMTCRGATCGTLNVSEPYSWINGNAMVIHPKDLENVKFQFIYYQLLGADLSTVITGAAQPQITRQSLERLSFTIPPLPIQEQIVKELDTLSDILAKRKEQLAELDTLAQATFYDMFGDPVENEKKWEAKDLGELGSLKNGLNYTRNEEGRILPFLGVSDFKENRVISTLASTISLDILPQDDYFLKENDFVFVRSNGSKELVGRCILFNSDIKNAVYSGFCIRFRLISTDTIPLYLLYVLTSKQVRNSMFEAGRGANISNVNQQMLSSISVPIPPLPLQNQFAERIEAIEKQKELINKSIVDVQLLFDYTMDKYFN